MSSDLSFGPSDRQWHYSPSTKTYDLSSNSPKKLTIPATEGPEGTSFTISPSSTALVIVDMQNFFLSSKCMSHPTGLQAVEPTIALIKKCRELGIQVCAASKSFLQLELTFTSNRLYGSTGA
jgi:isochorismate hydrolase